MTKTGRNRLESRRRYGFKQRWYSICSHHLKRDPECGMCDCGHWRYDIALSISRFVNKRAYPIWYWWANRPRAKRRFKKFETFDGKPSNPFPNLK